MVAHENHGHTHRGTATVPLMLVRPSCAVVLVVSLRFYGRFHQQEPVQQMFEAEPSAASSIVVAVAALAVVATVRRCSSTSSG